MDQPTESSPSILPCPPEERGAALGVLYQRMPEALQPYLVAQAHEEAGEGDLDLSGLWIARRRGRVVGALLTQRLAGSAAVFWPPEVTRIWGRSALAAALVRSALTDLQDRGVRVAQALVDAASPPHAEADLRRGGMPRVTELAYMRRATETPLATPPSSPAIHWRSFDAGPRMRFRQVLDATYAGSLDMPELEGARSLDDVLASHRAAGRFDPRHWWLGQVPGEPEAAALVLLTAQPDRGVWEVAYLGLTPPARGRGLGRVALAFALAQARPHVPRLELAVDTRNLPADRLYRAAGFTVFDRRAVHLALLGA